MSLCHHGLVLLFVAANMWVIPIVQCIGLGLGLVIWYVMFVVYVMFVMYVCMDGCIMARYVMFVMYVCMYVCMHGWMYVCTYACMYVFVRAFCALQGLRKHDHRCVCVRVCVTACCSCDSIMCAVQAGQAVGLVGLASQSKSCRSPR